ncbi:MAG: VOC family protein [Chloroflexota bacterium]|nr:VOC family protein [Chloroflexota bacterium]
MKIGITSVMVDDQARALQFYTERLGFVKKTDLPLGPDTRWLTVVSPDGPHGIELLLEPLGLPAAQVFQQALFAAGVPYTSFLVDDLQGEYDRLTQLGVVFQSAPIKREYGGIDAVLEDGCGNLINLHQE